MQITKNRLRTVLAHKTMEELESIIGAPADHYTDEARAAAAAEIEQRRLVIAKDHAPITRRPADLPNIGRSETNVTKPQVQRISEVARHPRMTVTVASGILHLDSADSIRTALRAGLIRGYNVLHPDDGAKPLTVAEYLEQMGDRELLMRAERARVDEVPRSAPSAANPAPNAVALFAAVGMLVGFFLPRAQLFGFAATVYAGSARLLWQLRLDQSCRCRTCSSAEFDSVSHATASGSCRSRAMVWSVLWAR